MQYLLQFLEFPAKILGYQETKILAKCIYVNQKI
jgi:hypothetical protein